MSFRGWLAGGLAIAAVAAVGGAIALALYVLSPPPPRDYLNVSLSEYFERVQAPEAQAPELRCVAATPVRDELGLLQGYCQGQRGGASADVALYGEGGSGLTRLHAVVQGAPAQLRAWWRAIASVFGDKASVKAIAWMDSRGSGSSHKKFDRLPLTFSVNIATREYVVDVRSAKDGTNLNDSPLPDVSDEALALLFAPELHIHPAETFLPIAISGYTSQTQVCRFRVSGGRVTPDECRPFGSTPPASECNPPTQTAARCFLALDILNAVEDRDPTDHIEADRRMRGVSPDPTVYWHVVRVNKSRLVIQYWLLYSFNNYSGKSGMNKHEGDWEHVDVDVRADAESGLPVAVALAYSAHEGAATRRVPTTLGRSPWHPVVYVALGSHANYFKPGKRYRVCITLNLKCVPIGFDKALDGGQPLLPPEPKSRCSYQLEPLTGTAPPWVYGAINLVVFPIHGARIVGQGPKDPRAKDEWRRPLSSFEHQNSKPVAAMEPAVCP